MKPNRLKSGSIEKYIGRFPVDVRKILERIRRTIKAAAPNCEESIKYEMPTFVLEGNLVCFGAFKKHVGFFPRVTAVEKFKKELSHYKGARGSVQFPLNKPIPFDLIGRMVKFRAKENLERAKAKSAK